jgi:KDO2-lipid IV(A) lauroyltransferase
MNWTAIRHRAEYVGYRSLATAFSFLPFPVQRVVAYGLGWFGGSVLRVRRKVVDENLLRAFPDESQAWRNRVARESYRHLVREAVAMTRFSRLGPEFIRARVDFEGEAEAREAIASGTGIVIVSGHLGNWELGGATLACKGFPVTAAVARQSNPLFNEDVSDTRRSMDIDAVFRDRGYRPFLTAIRKGRMLAMVADQNANSGAVFVDFFGVPAATASGPAVLAMRSGAPLYLAVCIRNPGSYDRYHIPARFVPVHEDDTVQSVVQRYTTMFEELIRDYPDQYFWHHRRWKTRPPEES